MFLYRFCLLDVLVKVGHEMVDRKDCTLLYLSSYLLDLWLLSLDSVKLLLIILMELMNPKRAVPVIQADFCDLILTRNCHDQRYEIDDILGANVAFQSYSKVVDRKDHRLDWIDYAIVLPVVFHYQIYSSLALS